MKITSFVFENSGRVDSSVSITLLSWTKGFQILVLLEELMTVQCTEAGSKWKIKSPFGAPNPEASDEIKVRSVHHGRKQVA